MERSDKSANLKALKPRRQSLHQNPTTPEIILWNKLKGKQLDNRKFRRQHSIENFILDFYCSEAKIGIEIDGDSHYSQESKLNDEIRTGRIAKHDIKVIRFTNKKIMENIDGVLADILSNIESPHHP